MPFQDHLQVISDELRRTLAALNGDDFDPFIDAIQDADGIFVSGAGRSGLMMRSFAMRLMHLGLKVSVVGETVTGRISKSDCLIIGSGSGTTESLVNHARRAGEAGAKIGLITIHDRSLIAELADMIITIPAPSPKISGDTGFRSAQPMGALFEQCLFISLEAIIMETMVRTGQNTGKMFARHANLE